VKRVKSKLNNTAFLVVTPILEYYETVLTYSQNAMKMIHVATQAKLWAYQ